MTVLSNIGARITTAFGKFEQGAVADFDAAVAGLKNDLSGIHNFIATFSPETVEAKIGAVLQDAFKEIKKILGEDATTDDNSTITGSASVSGSTVTGGGSFADNGETTITGSGAETTISGAGSVGGGSISGGTVDADSISSTGDSIAGSVDGSVSASSGGSGAESTGGGENTEQQTE
jgi:hypothetical protein